MTTPTWGYHPDAPPRIFMLKAGEKLPSGWHDTPAKFAEPAVEAKGTDADDRRGGPGRRKAKA